MRYYISGPMTGVKDFNRPLFNRVTKHYRERGCSVFNPAEMPDGLCYDEYLQMGLNELRTADIVVQLPGWESSKGAQAEYRLAILLGKKIMQWEGE
jgi:hypothetical protein